MRRFVLMAAALLVLAGCEHGGGIGMEFNADPSVSAGAAMAEISVIRYGAVSPTHITEQVTIDAGWWIERKMEAYKDFEIQMDSCMGFSELSREEYESVTAAVAAADLPDYTSPDPDSCEPATGTNGTEIVYKTVEGEEYSFDTGPCEIDEKIAEIIDAVTGLADLHVIDCSSDYFAGIFDDIVFDDDSEGFEVQDETDDYGENQDDDGTENHDETGVPPGAAE